MMKKNILFAICLFFSGALVVQAQDDEQNGDDANAEEYEFTSRFGHEVLPKKDEWSLGFEIPVVSQLQINSIARDSIPGYNFIPTVVGRLFKEDGLAYKAGITVNYYRNTQRAIVPQDTLTFNPDNPQFVTDKMHSTNRSIMLKLGLEKRRGSSRVQGVYGAEALLGYANMKRKYEYGNDMNVDFDTPTINDFGNGNDYDAEGRRITEDRLGNRFIFGIRGFAGVEYFIAPKWSLGVDVGYALGITVTGDREQTREYYDINNAEVRTVETRMTPNNPISHMGLSSYEISWKTTWFF